VGGHAKDRILYRSATQGTVWEIQEVLRDMRWVPAALKGAIAERGLLDTVRRDPRLGRV
jgi:hypothetical protein